MAVKDSPCRDCGTMMWRKSKSEPVGERRCKPCATRCGTVGGYDKGCRCDQCRAAKAAKMREYVAKRIERDGVSPTTALRRKRRGVNPAAQPNCYVCGGSMAIVRSGDNERPMHSKCRWNIPEWQRKPGGTSPGRKRFLARRARAEAGSAATTRVFIQGACAWCGEEFCEASGRYCSTRCKRRAGEARSHPIKFHPSARLRREVYERDGWTCGLCNLPIDRTLRWPDMWSASLDHITPQSHMLLPDHTAQNLRAAHLYCNALRGDGTNVPPEDLRARARAALQAA